MGGKNVSGWKERRSMGTKHTVQHQKVGSIWKSWVEILLYLLKQTKQTNSLTWIHWGKPIKGKRWQISVIENWKIIFVMFVLRERGTEGQREGDRIPSRLHTVSAEPDVGLKLTKHEIMIWAETKSQNLNWLSHPGTSEFVYILKSRSSFIFLYLYILAHY